MEMLGVKVWLDVALLRCPECGSYYVDASWYVIEMESDIACGKCGTEFNSKKNALDRAILMFQVDEQGKLQNVNIVKHLEVE